MPTGPAALEILKLVGEGRMGDAQSGLEERAGLKARRLRGTEFKGATVRAHAFRDIGNLKLPEALLYLEALREGDLPPDSTQTVWPAVQIAIREALINRSHDEKGRIAILEETVNSGSPATPWAIGELCDRGSQGSLSTIEKYYRQYGEPRASQFYHGCWERGDVLSRSPDPVVALGSVLRVANGFDDQDLTTWAINKLAAMKSPRAYAELERYMKEIDTLPEGSPARAGGSGFATQILYLLPGPTATTDRH